MAHDEIVEWLRGLIDDRPQYSGLGGAAIGANWGLEVAFWLSLVAFGMILGLTLVSVFEHVFISWGPL